MLDRLSRKIMKRKGFTLVELMIVVAVIALLILVLVPRIGLIKNKSREAGIRANMVMLEGAIQSVIDDYTVAQIAALETRIAADIDAADTNTNQAMRNPVTGVTGCNELGADADLSDGGAVVYLATTDDTDFADTDVNGINDDVDANWAASLPAAKGMVVFAAYENGSTGKINVQLIPYGADGKRITALEKIISQ